MEERAVDARQDIRADEAVGVLLIYEHRLVRPDDLSRVNRAFFHVNGVISVGLLVLVLVQLAVR